MLAGATISDRALLAAQQAKLEALQSVGESRGDRELAELMAAALRDGADCYDSAIGWAAGRVHDGMRNPHRRVRVRVRVPRARHYVALYTDGSGRWHAGEVGVALANKYPEKYDALLHFGTDPLSEQDRSHPLLAFMADRTFYFYAEAVVPFAKAMLPGPGEEPAYRTFEVARELRRQRGHSAWELIGWQRAPDRERAIAAARARWTVRPLRIGSDRDAEVTGGPFGREQPAELLRAWEIADALSGIFFDYEGHDKEPPWDVVRTIRAMLKQSGFGPGTPRIKVHVGAPPELVAASALVGHLREIVERDEQDDEEDGELETEIRDALDLEGFRP